MSANFFSNTPPTKPALSTCLMCGSVRAIPALSVSAAKWYRLKSEQAFSCQWCGHHIHPMVGSIFEKSRTPLQLWFYAIFLFTTTRNGVAAKKMQRQLGVTYKTVWHMAHLILEHMAVMDGEERLGGVGGR